MNDTRRKILGAAAAALALGAPPLARAQHAPIKRKLGVPEALYSCHTAVVTDYVVEGHVPAADVWRLLRERPKGKGLAVPGMPIGSPGMEQGPPQPYATMAFDERRAWVFERH